MKKKKNRGISKSGYIFRRLTVGNKTGNAYGITIPAIYIKKYNLFGKKFKLRVSPKGKFILYTKVKIKKWKIMEKKLCVSLGHI